MLSKLRVFLSECHFDVTTMPMSFGPTSALGGRELALKIPQPWRMRWMRQVAQHADEPWWVGGSREDMSSVIDQLMRSKVIFWHGVLDTPLSPEFAEHIGHLSQYAPLDK